MLGLKEYEMQYLYVLVAAALLIGNSAAQAQSKPAQLLSEQQDRPAEDRPMIVGSGHGSLFSSNGTIIKPSKDVIAQSIQLYLAQAQQNGGREILEKSRSIEDEVRKFSNEFEFDDIILDSIVLDWLLDQDESDQSEHISSTVTAMRKAYFRDVLKIDSDKVRLHYNTGLPIDSLKQLTNLGIAKFALTDVDSDDYIKLCRDQGVPIPPDWKPENGDDDKDRGDWRFEGTQNLNFASDAPVSEVYTFDTGNTGKPNGLCMALPRIRNGRIDLLGIICHSRDNGKACFWDNFGIGLSQTVPLEDFIGGNDLPGGGNTCSNCHAGENPYVVHPGTAIDIGTAQDSPVWHDPLVPASWPQNPGPTSLLNFIPLNPGERDCRECHTQNDQGRFPEVGALNQAGVGNLYCGTVLRNATNFTMPPLNPGDPEYAKHANALLAFCNQDPPDGNEVPVNDPKEDEEFLSAPIVVDPLYACVSAVEVRGAYYGAIVTIFIDGVQVAQAEVTEPSQQIIAVPGLVVGQEVVAVQEKNGLVSDQSPPVIVRDHTMDYPMGLPRPEIDPVVVNQCGNVIAVRHVRGANVTVFTNGASPAEYKTGGDWTNLPPAIRPFILGDTFTAQQSLCSDKSDSSLGVPAGVPPDPMPVPVADPAVVFEGQELMGLSSLAHGARTEVGILGGGTTGFSTAVTRRSEIDIGAANGGPLAAGQSINVVSGLCDDVKADIPDVRPCERLPAPTIAPPFVGNTYIDVISSVPSARIIVFDASNTEIGDGSGAQVGLSRSIVAGDVLTVIQRLDNCISSTGYQISALCISEEQGCQ